MGTNVVSGTATAVIVATGNLTYFGTVAKRLSDAERSQTSFQVEIHKISWVLIRFMAVMVPTVFLINGLTKGNWWEAPLFSLSVAVGLTPEIIVKHLEAIHNFGAMDMLFTDKTGHYQTGLKNLLDVAILDNIEIHHDLNMGSDFKKIDEIPFGFQCRG